MPTTRRFSPAALLLASTMLGVGACGSASPSAGEPPPAAASAISGPESGGEGDAASEDAAVPIQERMLVKTAALTVRVDDPAGAIERAVALADEAGGYSSSATSDGEGDDVQRAFATLRVPVTEFEAVMDTLRGSGELLHQEISTEDVTEAYVDIEARLRTQRALEARLIALVGQADTVADTIEVERELARVRGTVESLDAQTRTLAKRAAMATIELNAVSPSAIEGGGLVSTVSAAWHDAESIAIGGVGAFVRLLGLLLPMSIVGLPVLLVVRRRRRKSAPPPSSYPIPPAY